MKASYPNGHEQMIESFGLSINYNALLLLVDHIGNDLSRLKNEVEKISINLNKRKTITEEDM